MKITFLIGNGFDIALANKFEISKTGYQQIYSWNEYWNFPENEQRNNNIVKSINKNNFKIWSDFENGLISYFNNIKNEKEIIKFFNDKDQLCRYIHDFLKFFYEERMIKNNFVDSCINEFSTSVLSFTDRMSNPEKDKVMKFIKEKCHNNKPVHIDFINFNGTQTLELLLNRLKTKHASIKFEENAYKIVFGNIKYVHSKLSGKTENYHEYAFGTTATANINPKVNIPTSICNLLNKTNYSFDEWIEGTDLFITHGLSFGDSDQYYWRTIIDHLNSGSILIDFPFVTKEEKKSGAKLIELKKRRMSNIKKNDKRVGLDDKIIITCSPNFKPRQNSSSIFSF